MTLTDLTKTVERSIARNAPSLLTAIGVSGVLSTSYLTGRATFQAAKVLESEEYFNGVADTRKERLIEQTKLVWRLYIPAAVSGAVTITCIIGANRIGSKRAAAAYSLLTVSEAAFLEYKDKVVDTIGEKKEQAIRDEIAQDRINANPPSKEVMVISSGDVLCYEMHTGRYFQCNMETLRKAQNKINQQILSQMEASLDDFYYEVGLPCTTSSHMYGWDSGRMFELEFTTVLSPDDKACIAFDYNHLKLLYDRH